MTNPMDDLRQVSADVSGVEVLSPAAHAVVSAAHAVDWVNRRALAAALRAAARYCKRDTLFLFSLADELDAPYSY